MISASGASLQFDPGVAMVTGGSGGLGREIATRLAASGVPVLVTYHRRRNAAMDVTRTIKTKGGNASAHRLDLTKAREVDRFFSKYDDIRHVIYAAGPHFDFQFIGDIPDQVWRRVLESDVTGAFNLIQSSVKAFRKRGGGNLVCLTTSALERVPVRDILSAAPKAAVEMLTRGVAKEAGRYGIRANCVAPGWIDSGFGAAGLKKMGENKVQRLMQQVPLQRVGMASDVAGAVLFLCSRDACYVTGQTIAVDGGLCL